MDRHTDELEYLLNNYWCLKERDPETYFNIKNNLDYYKNFIQEKLGSKLIVNDRFIKLEKIPAVPKCYMGINDFTDKIEYVILLLVLLYLEDKPKNEQFVLNDLTHFITNTSTTLELDNPPDWDSTKHRKYFSDVMEYLEKVGIIKIIDRTSSFTEDKDAEALYETTGLANYFVREFKNNIMDYKTIDEYTNDEFDEQDKSIGDVRRYKVYRHLIYSLVAYNSDLSESEKDYLKKFRGSIKNELDNYIDGDMELSKNMALILYEDKGKTSYDFPNNKSITDVTLVINNRINEMVDDGLLKLNEDETININKEQFYRIIKDVKNEYQSNFTKKLETDKIDNFIKFITDYMIEYDFVRHDDENYIIYPMVSKMVGYYNKKSEEQLTLFGGEENE